MARAGQIMLSIPERGMRPRVTVKPAWVMAELTAPAKARLRVSQAACAVFQGMKRDGFAGASEDAKR